jgi:signal peptidase I
MHNFAVTQNFKIGSDSTINIGYSGDFILVDKDNQWQPLVDKKGKAIDGKATFRMHHFMGDKGKVFDLIVQLVGCKNAQLCCHSKFQDW